MLRSFKFENFFLSFFGAGYAPFAPGTFGTLATMPIIISIIKFNIPIYFLIPFYITTFVFSTFLINYVQKNQGLSDPSWIVIDEVLGVLIVTPFITQDSWEHYLLVFTLFRIFDITKLPPINLIDSKIKNGFGVIFDDIVAGIYTIVLYKIIILMLT
jgi:phosphatidylglycerophosphatase A